MPEENVEVVRRTTELAEEGIRGDPGAAFDECVAQGRIAPNLEWGALAGFKVVEDDPGFDLWRDTTTLYTRVLRGHVGAPDDQDAEPLAAGIIHIHGLDFAMQLTTFRTDPPGHLEALARFGTLFAGGLWEVYGPAARGETGGS